jgi:arginyl-tRNA synthetase
MHQISRKIPGSNPAKLATDIVAAIKADYATVSNIISDIVSSGVYINFTLAMAFLGRVVDMVLDGSFLAPLSSEGRDRVMIEYSQPVWPLVSS